MTPDLIALAVWVGLVGCFAVGMLRHARRRAAAINKAAPAPRQLYVSRRVDTVGDGGAMGILVFGDDLGRRSVLVLAHESPDIALRFNEAVCTSLSFVGVKEIDIHG